MWLGSGEPVTGPTQPVQPSLLRAGVGSNTSQPHQNTYPKTKKQKSLKSSQNSLCAADIDGISYVFFGFLNARKHVEKYKKSINMQQNTMHLMMFFVVFAF